MNSMTMGQRIALRRKLKNLSQEALAEQLEVSRQAISKWESDGAVPEVDKLIALGKIFGVSVGWLLGTEREEEIPLPGNSLTEGQITAVKEIVAGSLSASRPKRRRWPGILATAVVAVIFVLGASYAGRLEADNIEHLAAVESLRRENEALRDQMDSMQTKLNAVAEADRILEGMSGDAVLLDEQNIRVSFTFMPKVYQENAEAYLSIRILPYDTRLIPCTWNGEKYTAEAELPVIDNIQYSFLLVTEGMFREQNLMDPDFYYAIDRLSNPGIYRRFHLDPDSEQFGFFYQSKEHRWLDPELTAYTFREVLYSPQIFTENGRGYKEIRLTLQLNNEILWNQSLLEDFLRHSGGHPVSMKPFPLELAVPLPELKYGDKLELWLNVTMEDDQWYCVLLDEMFSWERPE